MPYRIPTRPFGISSLIRGRISFRRYAIIRRDHIGVSAISIVEMIYLIEKGRISAAALDDLRAATVDPNAALRYVPFDEEIAIKISEVSRHDVPDLPIAS